ncbi:ABC transporter substrate-binding protein [Actinomyces bowdenii]|uniref:Iron-siderophore ABC transporter substrate-binding protein n=1 Tax=Actinomyces bowdenii TaxID=131109 RepID=A0A3P1V7G2_9ACTO|nr:ABC transporter substrate-binding protein [Actinomyces bowdenii]RRD30134.1 iron-siderophore ABC transporter substrate-binding protein [Actinomyces bowdenii]
MSVSRKSFLLTASALPLGALLAACGSSSTSTAGASSGSGETISIKHAFGITEVPAGVTRVASVNWANQDLPLALGIMPVGFAKQVWGVEDDSGMLAWTKEKVDELVAAGADKPVLFDETDGIPLEAINSTSPEVILAAYSGLTEEDYKALSEIAPTVAYPTVAWGTPWREMITMDATAIGKKAEGEALITELEGLISTEVGKHPQIKSKSAAFFYVDETSSKLGFYNTVDPRTAFLADLGMELPASVKKASEANPTAFNTDISEELVDQLSDIDVIVMYGTPDRLAELQKDSLKGRIPAIANGAVAFVGDSNAMAASTNPGPLSLPWGIDKYVELIADAADKAK